jgi:periplasmic copper chaperone A
MTRFAVGLLIAVATLSACGQQTEKTSVAPEAKPGLVLSKGRLVLPAVKGNPAGGYFTLQNGADKAVTVAGVFITGATRAELHETIGESMEPITRLELQPGEAVEFKPGGKHVMAFGLDPALAPGSSTEITVTFADGDKLSASLKLEPAGGSMEHAH